MRLFIALDLPENIKDLLYSIQSKLKNSNVKANWVFKKNMHLTLKFLGEVSDSKLDLIKERLRELKSKKLEIKLENLGVFPNENFINIIWIGIEKNKNLFDLQNKIDEVSLDISKTSMKFTGHLTLARIKKIKNKEEFIKNLNSLKLENIKFKINEFKLLKSRLRREGPEYITLETYHLKE